jgi:predicted RNase H-like HicB family nuclease
MKKLNIQTIIYKEGNYYVAQTLGVNVSSFGKTKQEAQKNITEALELYFEDSSDYPESISDVELTNTSLSHV